MGYQRVNYHGNIIKRADAIERCEGGKAMAYAVFPLISSAPYLPRACTCNAISSATNRHQCMLAQPNLRPAFWEEFYSYAEQFINAEFEPDP